MGGIDSITFLGGLNSEQSSSSRDLIPDNSRISVRWESVPAQSKRDILIVVIGALIALGAATALEALRPFVDQIVAERVPLIKQPPQPPPSFSSQSDNRDDQDS